MMTTSTTTDDYGADKPKLLEAIRQIGESQDEMRNDLCHLIDMLFKADGGPIENPNGKKLKRLVLVGTEETANRATIGRNAAAREWEFFAWLAKFGAVTYKNLSRKNKTIADLGPVGCQCQARRSAKSRIRNLKAR